MLFKTNKHFRGIASVHLYSDSHPYTYSAQTILDSLIKSDMTAEQKAVVIYKFCVSHFCHIDHMPGPDAPWERNTGLVYDAIKLFNSYGFGLCWINCLVTGALYRKAGFPARIRTLDVPVKVTESGEGHTVTEAFYDNNWHVLDNDLMDIKRGDGGHILSAEERKAEPLYANTLAPFYGKYTAIHPMDIILYRGMSFNRYFEPQWPSKRRYRNCSHGGPDTCVPYDESGQRKIGKFGNFEIIYKPDLKDDTYLDGVYYSKNIIHSRMGLVKKTASPGEIIFSIYSPYAICGEYNKNKNGAIVSGKSTKGLLSVEISIDNGINWEKLWQAKGNFQIDVTKHAEGKYGCLVKIKFLEKKSVLNSLFFKTYGMLVPAALPFLKQGVNKITCCPDNKFLLCFTPDITSKDAFLKNKPLKCENIFWDKGQWGNLRLRLKDTKSGGHLVYKIRCPGKITKILGNVLFTHSAHPKTINFIISLSDDNGKTWQAVSCYKPPQDEYTWMSWLDIDHKLEKPVSVCEALVKISILNPAGDESAGFADINFYAYYETSLNNDCLVSVSHEWEEDGRVKIHKEKITGQSKNYFIKCGGRKIKNKSVKITCC